MSWVEEFFVKNPDLYASTIEDSLWREGEKTARSILQLLKQNKLGLQSRVLDVPCGMGRIAIPLAKLGTNVTGIDLSPEYVEIAKKKSKMAGVQDRTNFIVGRAEKINDLVEKNQFQGEFDLGISIHTCLGYGTRRDDESFLRGMRKAVRKDGLLVITARRNKSNIIKNLIDTSYQETDRVIVLQNNRYIEPKSRLITIWRFYRKQRIGRQKSIESNNTLVQIGKFQTSVKLYSTNEITMLLKRTGWNLLESAESINNRSRRITDASPGIFLLSTAV